MRNYCLIHSFLPRPSYYVFRLMTEHHPQLFRKRVSSFLLSSRVHVISRLNRRCSRSIPSLSARHFHSPHATFGLWTDITKPMVYVLTTFFIQVFDWNKISRITKDSRDVERRQLAEERGVAEGKKWIFQKIKKMNDPAD